MISTARQLASRRNARKSTGPRTTLGKARASRNARRHGFTLPVLAEPTLAPDVEALAQQIERQVARSVPRVTPDATQHALACRIAEAMIDLRRVRLAKLPLVAALHADPPNTRALRELARLDRYERYALWRRKTAIRAFDAAMHDAVGWQSLSPRRRGSPTRHVRVGNRVKGDFAHADVGARLPTLRRNAAPDAPAQTKRS